MSGADRPTLKPRELPDPDERGRVYEAMRAHASAEPAAESSDAAAKSHHQQADGAGQRDYRDEVPRFTDMWAYYETRWPETPWDAADLPTDAPTSSHRNGGLQPSPVVLLKFRGAGAPAGHPSISSIDGLASPGVRESDEEVDEFLAGLLRLEISALIAAQA